jgi:hypothetical protein
VAEALNRIIHEQGSKGKIRGVKVYDKESISHLLFEMTFSLLKEFIDLYCKATGMAINYRKFFLINCHKPLSVGWMKSSLSLEKDLYVGFKCLGFYLKPNFVLCKKG